MALAVSCQQGLPVRVSRGARHDSKFTPASGYQYAGLYRIEDYWHASISISFARSRASIRLSFDRSRRVDIESTPGLVLTFRSSLSGASQAIGIS